MLFGIDPFEYQSTDANAEIVTAPEINLQIPEKLLFLINEKWRFKAAHGGRGSAKSWSFARALIYRAHTEKNVGSATGKHLILCAREYQNSIADSVHRIITNQIYALGLHQWFDIQKTSIRSLNTGAEFIFKGLHHNINEIKSTEGITICWVEEAQAVSKESWNTLIPTIRGMDGAEIWVSYNPYLANDPTSELFQPANPEDLDKRAKVVEINFEDNPWFPPDMEEDRKALLAKDPDAYEHVYGGRFLQLSEATIFRNNYVVCTFDTPAKPDRFYYGVDFGFANDPSFGVRCYIENDCLYIDHEAYGLHTELDDLQALLQGGKSKKNGMVYPGLPGIGLWPVKADGARPETISYLRRGNDGFNGLNIEAATKWPGSVEDGITHLKGFKKIYIHERCPRMAQEARLYKWKVDKKTEDILPEPVDAHNHGWDACVAEGELVLSARGSIPIEQVIAGDQVWTRAGFKRVQATRMSGTKPIWELSTTAGKLYATADHRVFRKDGSVATLDTLRYGDDLIGLGDHPCLNAKQPLSSVRSIAGTRTVGASRTGAISNSAERVAITLRCTTRSGSIIEDQCRMDIMSITNTMKISRLQTLSVWNVSSRAPTSRSTPSAILSAEAQNGRSIWSVCANSPSLGTAVKRGLNFIVRMAARPGKTLLPQSVIAPTVVSLSKLQDPGEIISTADEHALCMHETLQASMTSIASAANAGKSSDLIATDQSSFAPVHVLCVTDTGRVGRTYDLSIEDQPEFFASGILVHNCRYALDGMIQSRGGLGVWAKLARGY
jgi:phage terminase large subunit